MASLHISSTVNDTATQLSSIIEKLLSLTSTKFSDKKQINACLSDLNELDYRCLNIINNNAILLLVNQLCGIVLPTETLLVQNICKFLYNLTQSNVKLHGRTLATCKRWILEVLEFAEPLAQVDVLIVIKSFLHYVYFDDMNHYIRLLLKDKGLLMKHLNPLCNPWSEINFHALGCLEEIVINKNNSNCLSDEFLYLIKDIILKILSFLPYRSDDKLYYSKVIYLCLHILHCIMLEKTFFTTPDFVGEILGVVQAFLFYNIKGYSIMRPQLLRPAAMNLPERIHTIPKCKNLKNHKAKSKKTPVKKIASSIGSNTLPEHTGISKYSSDSDASDTESNSVLMDFKVRLGAVRLMQTLMEITQSRDIFGYWPQIIATGSRNDARVLTRSILVEPVSKVRQNVLSTLTELLIGARPFLIHAEDTDHTSFITFFGTVCLMVKELHFTLSLILFTEKNVAVLTHALKCTAALIQGTPYERLKPGLATKLVRNCRPHIFHKDPTVRVAALSIFEAFASNEPITQEILSILAKQSMGNIESERLQSDTGSASDVGTEEEEIDIEDIDNSMDSLNEIKISILKDESICLLIRICLKNISNKTISTPVRLQCLKLMGRLAFNTRSLVFPHLEKVTTILISVFEESESQVVLHACRVLEIMSGCLANTEACHSNGILFWSIIFESMISLAQASQTILREAACDCLGSISANAFTQLPRQNIILIITILFGAVRDEESAVRAAGLRALGMLIILPALEDDTGFLMDLTDIVCLAFDDKNLGVRVKSAWTLANLCDCLSKQKQHEETEPFPLEVLLPKLYQVSVKATKDNDKVKCNAVRAIGSILYLCSQKPVLSDTTLGLNALIKCAILGNDMKVRWNACRALGLVLSHNPDAILPPSWKDQVFPALSTLICDSPNFKVRTNAAWALSSCSCYGKYTVMLWKSIVLAFENAQHCPSYVEYPHRDALIQQLCLTLSRVAACTEKSELQSLWIEIGDHVEEISNFIKQFQETILPEKLGDVIKAKVQLEQHMKNARCIDERQIAQSLANIFERTNRYDNLDAITPII